jgi:phage shock protein A
MGFFSRTWGYIKALVTGGVEKRMKPEVQIEQAMSEARKQDLELRNQAARVIAHRTELQMKLDRAIDDAADARAQAGQALKMADGAVSAGDAAEVDKWNRTAQALAMKLETSEQLVDGLKTQYATATEQAELAKEQVNANALRLQELSAKRMELLGKLEQARMQEQVNQTLEQLSKPMETNAGPTLGEIEDKINRRMANASARAELESASIEGAQRDVERSLQQASAQARLDKLREELGLPAPAAAKPAEAPAAVEPAAETPAVAPAPAEPEPGQQPAQGGGSAPA